jgi:2-iminoacetate synthase ThiH
MAWKKADAADSEWLAAANVNAKLKAAVFHLNKAQRSIELANKRMTEAGLDANLEGAARTIDERLRQVREHRMKLHTLYQLEY